MELHDVMDTDLGVTDRIDKVLTRFGSKLGTGLVGPRRCSLGGDAGTVPNLLLLSIHGHVLCVLKKIAACSLQPLHCIV